MILGTICARSGSKGIPGKNLRPLMGHPLILHTMMQAWECKVFDKLIVSTDDKTIAALAEAHNIEVQMRPPELATDTASKWDVFRYIAEQSPCDILVDLDVGCPLRAPEDITDCLRKLRTEEYDVVATAYEAERNPYFNMVQSLKAFHGAFYTVHDAITFGDYSPTPIKPITRRQDAPMVYSLSPAVFAIKVNALGYSHWSDTILGIHIIPRERAWDIDNELDFEIVEFLMGRNHD